MSQAAKVIFYTIPLSLIHITAFLGIFAGGLMLWAAHGQFVENIPFLGTVQNSPVIWAVVSVVLAVVAVFTNPSLYSDLHGYSASDSISDLVGALTGLLVPVVIGLAVISAPFFIFVALSSGIIYLSAHLAFGIYFLLMLTLPHLR